MIKYNYFYTGVGFEINKSHIKKLSDWIAYELRLEDEQVEWFSNEEILTYNLDVATDLCGFEGVHCVFGNHPTKGDWCCGFNELKGYVILNPQRIESLSEICIPLCDRIEEVNKLKSFYNYIGVLDDVEVGFMVVGCSHVF